MNDRYLYKAKRTDNGEWIQGFLFDDGFPKPKHYFVGGIIVTEYTGTASDKWNIAGIDFGKIDPSTICQCTGLKDKSGKLIWENDILMCHGNRNDLVKAVFGEFCVIDAETLEKIDRVIGWHYEVVQTDGISKCEPFCLSMPLTEEYVKRCEMEVVDNAELLEVMKNGL